MKFDLFCVGIVFYYPTKEQVEKVQKYSELVDRIYIYDNSENYKDDFVKQVEHFNNCHYFHRNYNNGISSALNYLCNKALLDGYKYILILDQDSLLDLENISILFDAVVGNQNKDIGVFSPKSKPILSIEDCKRVAKQNNKIQNVSEVEWTITSGSVIDLNIFSISGGFDENLFIDQVDYDYCKTLKQLGYKTVIIEDALLFQFLGEPCIRIFNIYQHNHIRHYYIFRNRLYMMDKYEIRGVKRSLFLFFAILKHILKVSLFESDKFKKFSSILFAIKDYKNNKMGRSIRF
jgi:rhamnosyltransferase